MSATPPTAAVLLIGDELLSGRTRDVNLQQIASFLAPMGIPVKESRTVSDEQADIVDAINSLRAKYTYVFTTGGIGPTHDDITADAVAAAFGVEISEHDEALAILKERYAAIGKELTAPRRRMARVPHGASLVKNPVSGAPGFQTGNVFTLAGVPSIARAMLDDIGPRLESGAVVHSVTIRGSGGQEGDLAVPLGSLAEQVPQVSFGSYPWFKSLDDHGVNLVARSTDREILEQAAEQMLDLFASIGITATRIEEADI
ncbi:MAG: molybdopterin-binding protein [Hyphomonadaceae bacterium]